MLEHKVYADCIYHIKDQWNNRATLVEGEERAFLFDTMMGDQDLKGYVSAITSKPLIVMNSHFHLDHVGANAQFDKVYCNDIDWPIIKENYDNTFTIYNKEIDMTCCRKSCENLSLLCDVKPGKVFDLGGIHIDVVDLKGHTKGSLGALVREKKILLVGDAISPQMCLFLGGQATLEEYRDTLERTRKLDFEGFLLSHFEGLYPKEILDEFIACAKLEGKKKGFPYEYSMIPGYMGRFFMYQPLNPIINELIGIILPETE